MNQKIVRGLVGAIALVAGSVFGMEGMEPYVDEKAGTILEIEKQVQDIRGNSHLVSYKVFVNVDGSYTAIPNSRSDNFKALNEEMCIEDGLTDTWDTAPYNFPANLDMPVSCGGQTTLDTPIAENAGTILDVEKIVQDIHGNSHPVSYKVFVNVDGSYTAITYGRSENFKLLQKEVCAEYGLQDAWETMTYIFPPSVDIPSVCNGSADFSTPEEKEEYELMWKKAQDEEITWDEFEAFDKNRRLQKGKNTKSSDTEKNKNLIKS